MPAHEAAADYADELRACHEDYRSGLVSLRKRLARTKAIWMEILERDLAAEVTAAIERSEGA